MVWNTSQSALYKAVRDCNGGAENIRKTAENPYENPCEKCPHNFRGKSPEKCRSERAKNGGFLESVPDRDFMLLVGLILILMSENADRKLILALAFALLG